MRLVTTNQTISNIATLVSQGRTVSSTNEICVC